MLRQVEIGAFIRVEIFLRKHYIRINFRGKAFLENDAFIVNSPLSRRGSGGLLDKLLKSPEIPLFARGT
jgi:hypothetical protein